MSVSTTNHALTHYLLHNHIELLQEVVNHAAHVRVLILKRDEKFHINLLVGLRTAGEILSIVTSAPIASIKNNRSSWLMVYD